MLLSDYMPILTYCQEYIRTKWPKKWQPTTAEYKWAEKIILVGKRRVSLYQYYQKPEILISACAKLDFA